MGPLLRNQTVVSLMALTLAACSDNTPPATMPFPPGQMMTPSTAAGAPAAGASAAGASGTGTAGRGTVGGIAGRGAAGSTGMAGAVAIAGRGAEDDDAGVPAVDAGTTPAPDAGTTTPEPRADLGEGDGSDVITIGDSWMSTGATGIQQSLLRASGQRYRTYGRPGTRLLNDQIPSQYASAVRADPDIKTVIMTGGGNDIIQVLGLREDCDAGGEMCGMVVGNILNRLTSMWDEMSADGVQDVVYVQYSNPEGENVDFVLPDGDGVPKRCEAAKAPLRCHRLETLDIVMGDIPDTIHPSPEAYDRIGKAVYEMMVEEGMRR